MLPESVYDIGVFFPQRAEAWLRVNILLKDRVEKERTRSACRRRSLKRWKVGRRNFVLVRRGTEGAGKDGIWSIKEMELCTTARERSWWALSGCGGLFTAMNLASLCATRSGVGKAMKPGGRELEWEKQGSFSWGEKSLLRGLASEGFKEGENKKAKKGWNEKKDDWSAGN